MRSFFTDAQGAKELEASGVGRQWRNRCVWIVGLWALTLLAYHDTARSIVGAWLESDTYSHGFLILPISLWLIWGQRHDLISRAPAISYLSLIALGMAGLAWFAGSIAYVQVVQQFSLVAILIALVWLCVGNVAAWRMMFPLAYLFFAVPFGEALVPPLMELTATQTVDLVRMTGIPVYREGLYFSLPTGDWSVVKACSGVRYLIASLALGTIFAYLNYQSLMRRALFMVAAFVVPVIANVLRAYMIVMLGHLSDMTIATGVDHLVYGWVFFGLVMFLLFWVGSWFSDTDKVNAKTARLAAQSPSDSQTALAPMSVQFASMTGAALLVLLFPLLASALETRSIQIPADKLTIDGMPALWRPIAEPPWSWRPPLHGADKHTHAFFIKDGRVFGVSVGVYLKQSQGEEMISYLNGLIDEDDEEWGASNRREESVLSNEGLLGVSAASLSDNAQTLSVYSWYDIGGFATANKYTAKLKELVDKATFRDSASVRILMYTATAQGGRAADAPLHEFIEVATPQVDAAVMRMTESAGK